MATGRAAGAEWEKRPARTASLRVRPRRMCYAPEHRGGRTRPRAAVERGPPARRSKIRSGSDPVRLRRAGAPNPQDGWRTDDAVPLERVGALLRGVRGECAPDGVLALARHLRTGDEGGPGSGAAEP